MMSDQDTSVEGGGTPPAGDGRTPPADTTSGFEDLLSAFGTDPNTTPDEGSAASASGDKTPEAATGSQGSEGAPPAGDASPQAPAELTEEQLAAAFRDPRVVTTLQQAQAQSLQQARALWEQELMAQRLKEEEALLDDEEIGRRVKEQQALLPKLEQAQRAGYARATQELIQNGIGDIWNSIDELKGLPDTEKATLNPLDPRFTTMGSYFSAVVDVVANKRAEKLAEKKAKELASAQVKSEVAKLRKSQPNPAGVPGNGTSQGPRYDVDRDSGRDILRSAFAE